VLRSALTRRELLGGGVLACIGMGCSPRSFGVDTSAALPLLTKPVPSTGERLPVIGLGSDSFRDSEREGITAELKRMLELGGTVIDTAAVYGDSEALIGTALASLGTRPQMFLATKLTNGGFFGGVGGEASLQRSLQRLQTQRLDLLQVHNLSGVAVLMPMLRAWKRAGTIRYLGVTTSQASQHAAIVEAMRSYPLDFIQVDYAIDDRGAEHSVFPTAQARGVAVLINVPFGRASLLSQAKGRKLPTWAADIDVSSWAQFFLKFVISHPAVTCAIPGSTKVAHLEDNQHAARGAMPDARMREMMLRYWEQGS
jgi:diketogulonate reductase-like aldo/keto reductase